MQLQIVIPNSRRLDYSPRPRRWRRVMLTNGAIPTGLIIGTLLIGFTFCFVQRGAADVRPSIGAVTPESLQNVSYCELLGPNPGSAADIPGYASNVSILWHRLCVQPEFVRLISIWGSFYLTYAANSTSNVSYWTAGNLSVTQAGSGAFPPEVAFTILWSAACNNSVYGSATQPCNYAAIWTGNVSTNVLTGPTYTESPTPPFSGTPTDGTGGIAGSGLTILIGIAIATIFALAGVALLAKARSGRVHRFPDRGDGEGHSTPSKVEIRQTPEILTRTEGGPEDNLEASKDSLSDFI
jgi:hypothetical protein